jgi:cell division septum initiation protein DivIVA
MPTQKLTPDIITAAIEGLERRKTRLDGQIAELRALLSGGPAADAATVDGAASTPGSAPRKRKKFSAAARRRMKEAQQLRWSKIRGESEPTAAAVPEPPKAKRRISPEGMKRIIAATKKRWRLAKAAKAQPATATSRKNAAIRKSVAKKAASAQTTA